MTLPTSGPISLASVNAEVGAAVGTARSLAWVRNNSFYAYKDLNSIHGLAYYQAVSSKGVINRTTGSTTTDCSQDCGGQGYTSGNCGNTQCPSPLQNCTASNSVNCNQCGVTHGAAMLQANCNCRCNCYNCNCLYTNCNCNCNDGGCG